MFIRRLPYTAQQILSLLIWPYLPYTTHGMSAPFAGSFDGTIYALSPAAASLTLQRLFKLN
jgi:hypothetical protein